MFREWQSNSYNHWIYNEINKFCSRVERDQKCMKVVWDFLIESNFATRRFMSDEDWDSWSEW